MGAGVGAAVGMDAAVGLGAEVAVGDWVGVGAEVGVGTGVTVMPGVALGISASQDANTRARAAKTTSAMPFISPTLLRE